MSFTLLAPQGLWFLLSVPMWLVIQFYRLHKSRNDLKHLRAQPLQVRMQWLPLVAMLLILTSLSLALARPAWNPQPSPADERGRDVIFLLDVSRSMLAADARPNRLMVAIAAIRRAINHAQGDRFGLVVFAGSSAIVAPLTNDKTFFNHVLDQVGPNSVAQGGTRIEDALFKVLDKMIVDDVDAPAVDLILLSDGEDLGSQPERTLDNISALGVRLLVIGLGDTEFGARVPQRDGNGWVFYQQRELWSRLHASSLRALAQGVDQGLFLPVGTANLDLAVIIEQMRQLWPGANRRQGEILAYTEAYPYLLWLSFALMLVLLQKRSLIAAMAVLSFTSHGAELSPNFIAMSLSQQQLYAARLVADDQTAQAAQVYRHIASKTDQISVVVPANYNLATLLIITAQQLSAELEAMSEGEALFDDAEELEDPELYYQEAEQILRRVLQQQPAHVASAQNLEWLSQRAQQQQTNSTPPQSPPEQQAGKQTSDESQPQSSQESEQASDDASADADAEQGESESELQALLSSLENVALPIPVASAEEILNQARQRDSQQRSRAGKKQKAVERDW